MATRIDIGAAGKAPITLGRRVAMVLQTTIKTAKTR